ncbi:MAG: amino acid permease [Acidobacteria bacterium]|nr:amino acid permease [Acidobacteriota bacterium]
MGLQRQLGVFTATMVVVASMIGTGIFLTTGIVLEMAHNALLVMILWVVAGLVALTGALSYAELATMWPEAGGEYVYLKKTFGYLPSFLTGWISLMVGFSAPVALSAIAFVEYINRFWQNVMVAEGSAMPLLPDLWWQKGVATVIVVLLGLLHIWGVRIGGNVQNVLTVIKIGIVVAFIGWGVLMADWSSSGRLIAEYAAADGSARVDIPLTGLALLVIMFSFSGWNGATYIAGEIRDPERNLPRALFWGTLLTTLLYLGLNVVFLISVPGQNLIGQEPVGAIAARSLFGLEASHFFTLGIALILLSSISAQLMVGPRVYYAMAVDRQMFGPLAKIHPRLGTPYIAIYVQMFLAVVYVLLGSAQTLLEYIGFALVVFPLLTVIGLMYLRRRHPELRRPYRVPAYPWMPLVYIVLSAGMMVAGLLTWATTSLFALGVILAGVPVYYLWRRFSPHDPDARTQP